MKRRLNTLRVRRNMPSFVTYCLEMKQSEELLKECLSRITINVTEFFRNRQRWLVLEEKIKQMAAEKSQLSIWSAACSTGEEPYSLAILLSQFMPPDRFSVTATDVDRLVLGKAQEGVFHKSVWEKLNPSERRCFTREGLFYRIDDQLKRPIRFVQHDLLSDPSPGRFDVIICRNVLIYFTNEGKEIIYNKLSESLKDEGLLFVGSTEQIFHPETYNLLSAGTFFYTKAKAQTN